MDKYRFKQLLESQMGNVKPLLNEDSEMALKPKEKPTVGSNVMIYKKGNTKERFIGKVCRIDGNYLYLNSPSDDNDNCVEYLWDPSGLKVKKIGNTYDIEDPTFNVSKIDCTQACKK